jgi:hypothetical protein
MGNSSKKDEKRIVEIGPGFYNIRSGFKSFKGLVNIGTHMSIIRLNNGSFVAIDTVELDDELKAEIDQLTNNGQNLSTVIATHPFHTLAFNGFYHAYPNAQYIGTPRHIRNIKSIPWAADISQEEVRGRWAPDIEMRIPAGSEFNAPHPEPINHFNSVWVYHRASSTIHIDDTVCYFENPGLLLKAAGKKHDHMEFHISLSGPGLYPTPDAPKIFKKWVHDVLNDWDFNNMCTAHTGNKIGGAKEALRHTLEKAEPTFQKLEKHHANNTPLEHDAETEHDPKDCEKYNVDGTECG